MQIYSETTYSFISKCRQYLKEIINTETDLEFKTSRFSYNNYNYPLHIITFTEINKIGFFDSSTYQIGLNYRLMFSVKESVLKDILRHEFAHYVTYIKYGDVAPHGEEYKKVCSEYGWDKAISKASMNIELTNDSIEGDLKAEKMIAKVKSLLNLAQSDNENEAKLATAKANDLILKHNLDINAHEKAKEETLYVKDVYFSKKRSSKLSAMYSILSHFLVVPIMNYTQDGVRLEITGNKTNIEIGEYIATFLDNELDKMWKLVKYKNNLKGLRQKNSFYNGVARGFEEKMNEVNKNLTSSESKALVLIKKQLAINTDRIYGRLKSSSSNGAIDRKSLSLGNLAGKNLNINQGINNKTKNKLIGWIK